MELVTLKNYKRGEGDPFWDSFKSMVRLTFGIEAVHDIITVLEMGTRYQMFPVRNHIGVTENKWKS